MNEAPLDPMLQNALNRYEAVGGVLDIGVFSAEANGDLPTSDAIALHKSAALVLLNRVQDRSRVLASEVAGRDLAEEFRVACEALHDRENRREEIEQGIRKLRENPPKAEDYWRLTVDEKLMQARRIGIEHLLGSGFDLRDKSCSGLSGSQSYVEVPSYAAFDADEGRDFVVKNLLDAILDPPHGLHISSAEAIALAKDVFVGLFGPCFEDTEVFTWSPHFSNYFESGLEWWGAYLWTVRNVSRRLVIAIGASATD